MKGNKFVGQCNVIDRDFPEKYYHIVRSYFLKSKIAVRHVGGYDEKVFCKLHKSNITYPFD